MPITGTTVIYARWTPVTLAAAIANMAETASSASSTYTLPSGNEAYTSAVTLTTANSPASVTIDGNGRTVIGNANRITVGAGVTLTLKNITFTSLPFTVAAGGTLVLDNGAVVQGNTGTGITVNDGTLELKAGALVTDNHDSGIVLDGTSATFNMSGGTISGNSSADSGGGVYALVGTTFNMTGGEISDNNADYGGGVFVNKAIFNMTGGEITGNIAGDVGGGVCLFGLSTVDENGILGGPQEEGNDPRPAKGWIHDNTPHNIRWPTYSDGEW
jgi:hypothetical protein